MSAKAAVPKGVTGSGGSTSKVAYSHGWPVGAGCWGKALVPLQGDLFMWPGLPYNMATTHGYGFERQTS